MCHCDVNIITNIKGGLVFARKKFKTTLQPMATLAPLYTGWLHHQIRPQSQANAVWDLTISRQFTWHQFHDRVGALTHQLMRGGIEKGDRIAYLVLYSPDAAEILFATPRMCAIHISVNIRLTTCDLTFVMCDCKPSATFYD